MGRARRGTNGHERAEILGNYAFELTGCGKTLLFRCVELAWEIFP
jgi:hypothetical protein